MVKLGMAKRDKYYVSEHLSILQTKPYTF